MFGVFYCFQRNRHNMSSIYAYVTCNTTGDKAFVGWLQYLVMNISLFDKIAGVHKFLVRQVTYVYMYYG